MHCRRPGHRCPSPARRRHAVLPARRPERRLLRSPWSTRRTSARSSPATSRARPTWRCGAAQVDGQAVGLRRGARAGPAQRRRRADQRVLDATPARWPIVGEIPTTALGRALGRPARAAPTRHAILGQVTKRAELLDRPGRLGDRAAPGGDGRGGLGPTPSGQHRGAGRPLVVRPPSRPCGDPVPTTPGDRPATRSSGPPRRVAQRRAPADRDRRWGAGRRRRRSPSWPTLLQAPHHDPAHGPRHGPDRATRCSLAGHGRSGRCGRSADVVLGIGSRLEWPLTRWGVDPGPDARSRSTSTPTSSTGTALDDGRRRAVTRRRSRAGRSLAALDGRPDRADRTAEVAGPARAPTRSTSTSCARSSTSSPRSATSCPDDGVLRRGRDAGRLRGAPRVRLPPAADVRSRAVPPARSAPATPMGVGAQAALDPRAVAASALVVAGDGGFLFTGNELATAVQHEIPLVTAASSTTARSATSSRIQEQRFGDDRTIVSSLRNPDFVAFAGAFGALGLHAGFDRRRSGTRLERGVRRTACPADRPRASTPDPMPDPVAVLPARPRPRRPDGGAGRPAFGQPTHLTGALR